MKRLIIGLALSLTPALTFAFHYKSGHDLLAEIQACSAKVPDEVVCQTALGYVQGTNDFHSARQMMYPDIPALYCIKGADAPMDLARVALKHLETDSAQLHLPAAALVIEAYTSEWPCPDE